MKVINFFGAPGAGKTTMTLELGTLFKKNQVDVGVSLEMVKEYIHSGNENFLSYQNYIFAHHERQLRIFQNSREIEFALSDSPLPLSVFYEPENYPVYFKDLVFEFFNSFDNINYFVERNHEYSHQGRVHNKQQSEIIHRNMMAFLMNNNVPFTVIKSTDDVQEHIFHDLMQNHRVQDYLVNKKMR